MRPGPESFRRAVGVIRSNVTPERGSGRRHFPVCRAPQPRRSVATCKPNEETVVSDTVVSLEAAHAAKSSLAQGMALWSWRV